ncbi:MAG: sigma-70 family RNA polymerase sigma factor [Candidatus Margulisiibacteriota bacterium]
MSRIARIRSQYSSPKLHPFKDALKSFSKPYFSPSISQTTLKEDFRSREEELALFQQIKFGGRSAEKARETLARQFRKHIFFTAMKYLDLGLDLKDLVQEGYVGLMKAIKKFEPERGFRFSTMAPDWIRAEIQYALVFKAHDVRLPRNKAEAKRCLGRSAESYRALTGEYPTIEQLSEMLGLPLEKVEELLSTNVWNISFDHPVNKKDGPTWHELIADQANLDLESAVIAMLTLRRFLNTLPPDHKRVLELLNRLAPDYPGQKMNYREAGEIMGMTRQGAEQKSEKAKKILNKKSSNSQRLSPYKKWSDDEKALNLMLKALSSKERKLFELTYKNWVTKARVAEVFEVPKDKVTELRNKLEGKLDKMYGIIQRERIGLKKYSRPKISWKLRRIDPQPPLGLLSH